MDLSIWLIYINIRVFSFVWGQNHWIPARGWVFDPLLMYIIYYMLYIYNIQSFTNNSKQALAAGGCGSCPLHRLYKMDSYAFQDYKTAYRAYQVKPLCFSNVVASCIVLTRRAGNSPGFVQWDFPSIALTKWIDPHTWITRPVSWWTKSLAFYTPF